MPLPNMHVAVCFPSRLITGECRAKSAEMHGKSVTQTHCQMRGANSQNVEWKMQRVLFGKTIWTAKEVQGICSRQGWKFEEAKPIQKSDLPEGKFVRRRQIIKTEGGVFIKG